MDQPPGETGPGLEQTLREFSAFMRSFVRWGPWALGLVVVCLVVVAVKSVTDNDPLTEAAMMTTPIIVNIGSIVLILKLKPRILERADLWERMRGPGESHQLAILDQLRQNQPGLEEDEL